MLVCEQCGHVNAEQSKFCNQCGAPLSTPSGDTRVIPAVTDDVTASELRPQDQGAIGSLPPGRALLVVLRGDPRGGRFLLDKPETVAGRHVDADVFLDDITVSRHHARFDLAGDQLTVTDLGSLNGTYVNRQRIDAPTALANGDEVQIGKFRMACYLGGRA